LRAISATSRILMAEAEDSLDEEMRDLLRRQAKAATRLGTLIDELLKLSRLSRSEMTSSTVDISGIASTIADEIQGRSLGAMPVIHIQDGIEVEGDDRLLRLVMANLLENAVKFSPEGAVVTVGSTAPGTFYVQDLGIGFDPTYAAKIWLPFERLVTEDEFPGTGIGLANVKRIVDRHGGQVWAESTPGSGAVFHVSLPNTG
jgi:signal transduction histidine kinase